MSRKRFPTRRDQCFHVGGRAARLTDAEAVAAWRHLAGKLQDLGEKDLPKYDDLARAIRQATIEGRRKARV